MCQSKFDGLTSLDFNHVSAAVGRDIGQRMIYAVRQEDTYVIRSHLVKLADPDQFHSVMDALDGHLTVPGYAFPETANLPSSIRRLSVEGLSELTLSIAFAVTQFSNPVSATDSPSEALVSGLGQCFDRASIMVAVCRANSMPARVVGHPHFFGDDEDDSHWWVEVQVDGKWQSHDPSFHSSLNHLLSLMEFDPDAIPFIVESHHARSAPIDFISDPAFAEKVKTRLIAPELDHQNSE
ncbi:transglutaminase domain-containing protein [Candidatus Micrarchaeota archaeon]|nr:transglutaminase domain-containing protein [Candidatus Micrarchaeota archaeon]